MAHELNLKNRYHELIHEPLNKLRGGPVSGGRDISLSQYLGRSGLRDNWGNPLTVEGIWSDIGLDPKVTTMMNVLTLSDSPDLKYFASEVIRDFLLLGMHTRPYWQSLCMREGPAIGQNVVTPYIKFEDELPSITGETENIPETTYAWGIKRDTFPKIAKGIWLSDELLYQVTLPILGDFLQRIGAEITGVLNGRAVLALLNGSNDPNVEDSCAMVGIASPGSLAYEDFVNVWARGDHIVFDWKTLVSTETDTKKVLALREFKWREFAGIEMTRLDDKDRITPARMPHYQSSKLPVGQLLLVDPAWALIYQTFMGLRVETDRLVMRQMNGTAVSLISGFTTVDRRARIIIDTTKNFSSAGFPDFLTPLD